MQSKAGDQKCAQKFIKRRKCHINCKYEDENRTLRNELIYLENNDINCVMSEWSQWSKCDKKCKKSYQERYRHVLKHSAMQKQCLNETERKPCTCG